MCHLAFLVLFLRSSPLVSKGKKRSGRISHSLFLPITSEVFSVVSRVRLPAFILLLPFNPRDGAERLPLTAVTQKRNPIGSHPEDFRVGCFHCADAPRV
ncbi:hypothetical protein NDU88_002041 [Pleurodeles waltl]|uniref:Secreted protein n=1 Tax=Pleurodeles waltl TaxID=8319 RepID=A0AAV7SC32_PLEWA|nr:hypothetical protein NDU88_002041 [Pleurodeles waltl]